MLTLYSYFRSSCSWRVRIALNLKGVDYKTVPVHLVKDGGEQHQDAYRKMNPMSQVPSLVVDDNPIAQSMAMLEYLEETYPDPPLLPADKIARAQVRQMAELINSGIQPIQNLRVMQKLRQDFDLDQEATKKWSADWIALGFDALTTLVKRYGGRYCFGDAVTTADLCLVPQIYNARRFNVDLDAYPELGRIDTELGKITAFQQAHPDQQPDAPA